jgi:hypothetical protein
MTDMLALPSVTLVAIDTACHDLTAMALNECIERADFGEVLVITDKALPVQDARMRYIQPFTDSEQATRAMWYVLPPLLRTDHFMVVHWDSWIVNPRKWNRDFLAYDYIGAPWWYGEDRNVGNGGFSLRSTRLANYMAGSSLPFAHPEDDALCRRYRPRLEFAGFTWAPVELAARFSFERVAFCPLKDVFGFHGMFNWPHVLSPEQIEERVAKAPDYVLKHVHYDQMRMVQAAMKEQTA